MEERIKAHQIALDLAHEDVWLNAFLAGNVLDAALQRAWQLLKEVPAYLLPEDPAWLGALVEEMVEA